MATFFAGQKLTAAQLEAVAAPPTATALRNANQSIPNSANTLVSFDAEETDNCSGFAPTSTNLVIPSAGVYDLVADVAFEANATGVRFAHILVNGTRAAGSSAFTVGAGTPHSAAIAVRKLMAAADVITLQVFQSSGGALNIGGSALWLPAVLSFRKVLPS